MRPGAFVPCTTHTTYPLRRSSTLLQGDLSFVQAAGEDIAITGHGSFKGQGSHDSSVERAGPEQEPYCRLSYQWRGWVPSPLDSFAYCPRAQPQPKGSSIYHQHGNLALHMGVFTFCALSCSLKLPVHEGVLWCERAWPVTQRWLSTSDLKLGRQV